MPEALLRKELREVSPVRGRKIVLQIPSDDALCLGSLAFVEQEEADVKLAGWGHPERHPTPSEERLDDVGACAESVEPGKRDVGEQGTNIIDGGVDLVQLPPLVLAPCQGAEAMPQLALVLVDPAPRWRVPEPGVEAGYEHAEVDRESPVEVYPEGGQLLGAGRLERPHLNVHDVGKGCLSRTIEGVPPLPETSGLQQRSQSAHDLLGLT
jgi:hypothetical protein